MEKSVDGVLGIQTQDCRMEDEDESIDLWHTPYNKCFIRLT